MRTIHENYWKFFKDNRLQKQREIRRLPLNEIKKIQWKRLKKLLDYVYSHNEFYRGFFESSDLTPSDIQSPEDLLRLPTTEKKVYRENFDKIVSKEIDKNSYGISSTSGSTGEPFKFYIDKKRQGPNTYAAFVLNKEGMGIKPFKRINELEIKAEPRNEIKNLKQSQQKKTKFKFRDLIHPELVGISAHKIKRENLDDIINIIKEKDIGAIIGYSSSILLLAELLSEQGISFNLEYIITIGEACLDQQREYIVQTFNCPVYLDYTASECLYMGSECGFQNGYHMDLYNYYFEFMKDGGYAKNNEIGEIVVTNLNNYIFPFVRYKVGDTALLTDLPCKCDNNFPLVKEIHGRSGDVVKTPTGKEIASVFISVPFKHLHEYIRQYQLIQVDDNNLIAKIVPTDLMNERKLDEIKNILYDFVDRSMIINIQLVKEIDAGRSGKKKVVITKTEYERLKGKTE